MNAMTMARQYGSVPLFTVSLLLLAALEASAQICRGTADVSETKRVQEDTMVTFEETESGLLAWRRLVPMRFSLRHT